MYNLGYVLVKGSIELSDKVKSLKAKARVKQAHKNKSNVRISEEEEDLLFSIEHITALSKEKLKDGLHWLRAAAENGVSDAFYQIGRLYEQVGFTT